MFLRSKQKLSESYTRLFLQQLGKTTTLVIPSLHLMNRIPLLFSSQSFKIPPRTKHQPYGFETGKYSFKIAGKTSVESCW